MILTVPVDSGELLSERSVSVVLVVVSVNAGRAEVKAGVEVDRTDVAVKALVSRLLAAVVTGPARVRVEVSNAMRMREIIVIVMMYLGEDDVEWTGGSRY
jgi:hypothetical protein